VSALPPELLRKGRFDEIFFVDLPSQRERADIWRALAKKYKQGDVAIERLAALSDGFSGAEIEAALVSAMFRSFSAGRSLESEDLSAALAETVPLSKTAAEKINQLRSWAKGRARPASIVDSAAPSGRALEIE